jgi:hypothetical protein
MASNSRFTQFAADEYPQATKQKMVSLLNSKPCPVIEEFEGSWMPAWKSEIPMIPLVCGYCQMEANQSVCGKVLKTISTIVMVDQS